MRTVLPFSVFVDAQGHIVALKVGELHSSEADFILGEIRSLDRGASASSRRAHRSTTGFANWRSSGPTASLGNRDRLLGATKCRKRQFQPRRSCGWPDQGAESGRFKFGTIHAGS